MDPVCDDGFVATNDDAALCKYQAISRGYYKDCHLEMFLPSKVKHSPIRKAPEINRGYYARSAAIAYLVEQFIISNTSCQIISLGAGYDTLYWRLKEHDFFNEHGKEAKRIKYVEVDMSVVTIHKIMAIKRHSKLANFLTNIVYKGEGLHSDQYDLISFDLRQVDKESFKLKLIEDCHLDMSKPTLCIAECVLVYMPNKDSSSLINWLSDNFTNLSMLNYEQCNMKDRFGDIMLENMNARHCDLMGVEACESLESQSNRFKSNGFKHTKSWTLLDIFKQCLSQAEISRIESLEFLDEKELLDQLLQHYCIVVASQKQIDWISDEQYWLAKSL